VKAAERLEAIKKACKLQDSTYGALRPRCVNEGSFRLGLHMVPQNPL
jgi:hypothetical protein